MWLTQAQRNGEAVIFISLGSAVQWQPWYVRSIYEGCLALKKAGIPLRVCWAMKSDICTIENHDPNVDA